MSATQWPGQHVWIADHFSVPAETLCTNRAASPDADCFCLRAAGHPGKCAFTMQPDVREYSWKDPKPVKPCPAVAYGWCKAPQTCAQPCTGRGGNSHQAVDQ